jgi:Ala-tRNA(Pro) deacylase
MSTGPANGDEQMGAGVSAIVAYLEAEGISHRVVEHRETFTAVAEARATDALPAETAKTVVLHAGERHLLAVVPASERVDLGKLRSFLGAGKELRLASEAEIAQDFPRFEVGAVPPLGPVAPAAEVVDRRLLEADTIVCAGGDHRHAVALDPRDLVRTTAAKVADISED